MTDGERAPFSGFSESNTTPVPDVFFDSIMTELGFAELRVLLYLFRRTSGFKRSKDAVSLTQFVRGIRRRDGTPIDNGCGVRNRTNVMNALESLEQRGLITITRATEEDGQAAVNVYAIRWRQSVIDRSTAAVLGSTGAVPGGSTATVPGGSTGAVPTINSKRQTDTSAKADTNGVGLSLTAQRVLEAHRAAYGRAKPIAPNPTLAARLEKACVESGEDALKKAMIWAAEKMIPFGEIIKAINGAKTIAAGNGGNGNGGNGDGAGIHSDRVGGSRPREERANPFARWDDD